MADIFFIQNLIVETKLGTAAWERAVAQKIALDAEFTHHDIRAVSARLMEFISTSEFEKIEQLAEAIAQILLQEFSSTSVKLKISQLRITPQTERSGVMIERSAT